MNNFKDWMTRMGFRVAKASEEMGVDKRRADRLSAGQYEATRCERLAMAAVAAGIPEWTPENADMIDRIRRAADAVQGRD